MKHRRVTPNNRSHHIPGHGSKPPQATAGLYPVLLPVGACEKPNYEGWVESACWANQVMGLPLTIFHDMWLVRSKRLTTTTTHYDLSQFINTDGVHSQVMIHNPVRDPYGDCRIINNQLLCRASDRKSLDFCRSYEQSIYSTLTG